MKHRFPVRFTMGHRRSGDAVRRFLRDSAVLVVIALVTTGCGGGESADEAVAAENIGLDSCVLCSMTVAEQPAPRAQVVHRDGTRIFLCAASELGPYLEAPSSHGKPSAVFVEVLAPGDDGSEVSNGIHPWVLSGTASYVIEGPRRPVMGKPVLAFAKRIDAEEVASAIGGSVVAWEGLQSFLQPNGPAN